MQASLDKPQAPPSKVKNILIRRTCSKKVLYNSPYQHPETAYILKYAPKYYKSLTLQTTCQSPLLSKVKKIKKLQKFTGYFDRHLPQQLWFDLLGNNRKEIEEAPQISSTKMGVRPTQSFWTRLNEQKLKSFWNLKRVWLPKWRDVILINDRDNFLSSKEMFVEHVSNLRKLKSLKITVKDDNYDSILWVLSKLDGMDGLLKRLEILSLDVGIYGQNVQEVFKNKKVLAHTTGVSLSGQFDPIFSQVPIICKNLNSLTLNFDNEVEEKPEFRNLLTSTQELAQLKHIEFNWPRDGKNFWRHFKPQPSLEHLILRFSTDSLVSDELFEGGSAKDAVAHWEEMKELKSLEFNISGDFPEQFNLVKMLMTRILNKVRKLEELRIWVGICLEEGDSQKTCEPFFVEEVGHLYESLERFEYQFFSWTRDRSAKFDLKTLMPFRNLKSLKLEGDMKFNDNIEEIVSLLEGNQKKGEYPVLEFNLKRSIDSPAGWLREVLRILERTKKPDTSLKVIIDLTFGLENYMEIFEGLCRCLQSAGKIKGLKIVLNFNDDSDDNDLPVENIRELSRQYSGVRNLNVVFSNASQYLEWIKIEGEKEQLFMNAY